MTCCKLASDILRTGDYLQVVGIAAGRLEAQVIECQPIGDRFD